MKSVEFAARRAMHTRDYEELSSIIQYLVEEIKVLHRDVRNPDKRDENLANDVIAEIDKDLANPHTIGIRDHTSYVSSIAIIERWRDEKSVNYEKMIIEKCNNYDISHDIALKRVQKHIKKAVADLKEDSMKRKIIKDAELAAEEAKREQKDKECLSQLANDEEFLADNLAEIDRRALWSIEELWNTRQEQTSYRILNSIHKVGYYEVLKEGLYERLIEENNMLRPYKRKSVIYIRVFVTRLTSGLEKYKITRRLIQAALKPQSKHELCQNILQDFMKIVFCVGDYSTPKDLVDHTFGMFNFGEPEYNCLLEEAEKRIKRYKYWQKEYDDWW